MFGSVLLFGGGEKATSTPKWTMKKETLFSLYPAVKNQATPILALLAYENTPSLPLSRRQNFSFPEIVQKSAEMRAILPLKKEKGGGGEEAQLSKW